MLTIRNYEQTDWNEIKGIHDGARKIELELAGLSDAFLPLETAAEREGLFEYPGLFVAELEHTVAGFAACTEEELAWLYVDPEKMRRGIGRSLTEYALKKFPGISYVEALKGNEPARKLYENFGFTVTNTETGQMPGNEDFTVEVYVLKRQAP